VNALTAVERALVDKLATVFDDVRTIARVLGTRREEEVAPYVRQGLNTLDGAGDDDDEDVVDNEGGGGGGGGKKRGKKRGRSNLTDSKHSKRHASQVRVVTPGRLTTWCSLPSLSSTPLG